MRLIDLFVINGDWDDNTIFEIHDKPVNDIIQGKVLLKGTWKNIPTDIKNTNVYFFNTVHKNRVWIEI